MQASEACTKTHFEIKKAIIFWGGDTPSPDRLRRLDLHAYSAQAQRDTPQKNPSYSLVSCHTGICDTLMRGAVHQHAAPK